MICYNIQIDENYVCKMQPIHAIISGEIDN